MSPEATTACSARRDSRAVRRPRRCVRTCCRWRPAQRESPPSCTPLSSVIAISSRAHTARAERSRAAPLRRTARPEPHEAARPEPCEASACTSARELSARELSGRATHSVYLRSVAVDRESSPSCMSLSSAVSRRRTCLSGKPWLRQSHEQERAVLARESGAADTRWRQRTCTRRCPAESVRRPARRSSRMRRWSVGARAWRARSAESARAQEQSILSALH